MAETLIFDPAIYEQGAGFAPELYWSVCSNPRVSSEGLVQEARLSHITEDGNDPEAPKIQFDHPSFVQGLMDGLAVEASKRRRAS